MVTGLSLEASGPVSSTAYSIHPLPRWRDPGARFPVPGCMVSTGFPQASRANTQIHPRTLTLEHQMSSPGSIFPPYSGPIPRLRRPTWNVASPSPAGRDMRRVALANDTGILHITIPGSPTRRLAGKEREKKTCYSPISEKDYMSCSHPT